MTRSAPSYKYLKIGLLVAMVTVIVISLQRCHDCVSGRFFYSSQSDDRTGRQLVLLITNARSGSSFSSELIAANPQVFYYFEPLFMLMKLQMDPNDKSPHIDGHYTFDEAVPIVDSYYSCAPRNISLFDSMLQLNSGDTNTTQRCIMNNTKTGHEHLACYFDEVNTCLSRRVTLIKLVRFRLKWSRYFLEKYSTAKILFLIRDPREVLYSQGKNLKHFDWALGAGEYAKKFCSVLREDLDDFRTLSSEFPGRVKAIRYEDGAVSPKSYARHIYKFLGLPYTLGVDRFVTSLAYPAQSYLKKERPFNVFRADAVKTMNNWRHAGGWGPLAGVEAACRDLLPALGYLPIQTEEHLTSEDSLVTQPDFSAGIL